jgi:hypothetical protein
MSRRDPLDELAEQLFEAGRHERPPPSARERALHRGGSGVHSRAPSSVDASPHATGRRWVASRRFAAARRRYLPGAAVALALAAAALLGLSTRFGSAHRDLFSIAPEQVASEPPAIEVAPAPNAQAARASNAEPAAPAPAEPPVPAEPAASEPTRHAARARAGGSAPTLADEVAALDRARAALTAGDAARALALVDQYERVLRGTTLRAEAALLRIEALAASGRRAQAEALARRFVAQHPGSPLADRARALGGPGESRERAP